jgi:hypothetical protein
MAGQSREREFTAIDPANFSIQHPVKAAEVERLNLIRQQLMDGFLDAALYFTTTQYP